MVPPRAAIIHLKEALAERRKMVEDRLQIGTSGWTYPSWRGPFYPPGLPQRRWLAYYASAFTCVEINGSFYGLPKETTFRSWGEAVPAGFSFAVKGSRYVTHFKRLRDARDSVALVTGRARALGEHLGPILWQLRPDMEVDLARLDGFLDVLPADLKHVLEPRHPSWFVEAVEGRCAEAGVALASWEMLGHEQISAPTAPFVYVRFHGLTAKYGGSYGEAALAPWARRCREWLDDGREVWAFFNNDIDGHAIADARRLRTLIPD
jgi:uncharacterized protein YecE (DUF72 family)